MNKENQDDWIDHYGLILVSYAHMTDWWLAQSEMQVIHDKMEFLIASTKKSYKPEIVNKKIVTVLDIYESLNEDSQKMDALFNACRSLKKEAWFDNLAAALLLSNLADIAEADYKIEKTEIQFLKNIADVFEVKPPRL